MFLTVREDQTRSRYTFKVLACSVAPGDEPPDLSSLALDGSVQEVVDALKPERSARRGGLDGEAEEAAGEVPPLWGTWDLPVVVVRA